MTGRAEREIAGMDGEAALPRRNGDLVFEEPWEGRAFGIAVALQEQGLYQWREFRDRLAEEIAAAEQAGEASTYYERWLASLERLLVEKGVVTPAELDFRTEAYASGEREEDDM